MELTLSVIMVEGRVKFVRPMDATPIDNHHHLLPGWLMLDSRVLHTLHGT
jgi:hypothetical protein